VSSVDPKPRPTAPRLSFPALQHSQIQEPFFSPLSRRPRNVALLPRKSHPQGLATLSVVSAPEPLEASSSPRHSWAPPFKAFLLHGDPENLSIPRSAPALSLKTFSASSRRSDGLLPPWKPYPSSLPDGLDPAGALALLGFTTSQALPPSTAPHQHLSGRVAFPVLASLVPHETGSPHPQGLPSQWPGFFPYGTPACLAFLPSSPRALFEPVTDRGLFFPLEGPQPLTKPECLLFAATANSPNGRA